MEHNATRLLKAWIALEPDESVVVGSEGSVVGSVVGSEGSVILELWLG